MRDSALFDYFNYDFSTFSTSFRNTLSLLALDLLLFGELRLIILSKLRIEKDRRRYSN